MAFFDLPLDQLREYRPDRTEPADFDSFWSGTLAAARQHPLNARFEPVDYHLKTLETFDVTFAGYGGQPIKGWFILPRERSGPKAGSSCRGSAAVRCPVWSSTSAMVVDGVSQPSGFCIRLPVMRCSSWIHAGRAVPGDQAIHPIFLMELIPASRDL